MRMAIAGALLLLGISGAWAAPNDFQVQSVSGVPDLKVGAMLERGTQVSIPEGGRVVLIERTGRAIRARECGGPHTGPIEACPKPAGSGTGHMTPGGTRGRASDEDARPSSR
jgi:hypothetical protein